MTIKRSSYFVIGILICVLGSICFSTKAIFVKLAYRDTEVTAVALLALRMIFSLPFFVANAVRASVKQDNVRFTTKQWIQIAVIGCLGYYVSSLLDFLGLQYVSAGIERLILFIYPTLVLIISSVIFKDRISGKQWLAVSITYIGLIIAFVVEADWSSGNENFLMGSLLIFACAITFALYIVGSGRIIPIVGAAKFNSYAMSFACAGVIMHFLITGHQSLFDFESTVYSYSAFMAIIGTVIPSYLIAEGIKRVGSDNAAIIGSIGPVSTIIQAYFFLSEPISALQLGGTVLVLVGVLMIGKKSSK
jgi:drug/metabolite transporter (DMT)-like permease